MRGPRGLRTPGWSSAAAAVALLVAPLLAKAFKTGPPPGVTGGFGEPTCHACHFDHPINAPGGSLRLGGLPESYTAGVRYSIRVGLTRRGTQRAGFQIAESELRTALSLDPRFVPALVNLADLLRAQGRDADGERFLDQALRVAPDHAEALHAIGLLRIRQNRLTEAVDLLRRAAARRPDSPRFAYVYAVALHDTGRARDAIAVLEATHRQRPADRETLAALATYLGERGDVTRALGYAEKLAALDPDDPAARRLVETLRRRAGAR